MKVEAAQLRQALGKAELAKVGTNRSVGWDFLGLSGHDRGRPCGCQKVRGRGTLKSASSSIHFGDGWMRLLHGGADAGQNPPHPEGAASPCAGGGGVQGSVENTRFLSAAQAGKEAREEADARLLRIEARR